MNYEREERNTMEEESATTIDSSSDNNLTIMESNEDVTFHPISSSGADIDEESETDELTIDDSCVNNEDMMDDDNNVAIVSSSTLHQINDDEDVQEEGDECSASSSGPEAVAVMSKPICDDDVDDATGNNDIETKSSQQPMVSTSSTSITKSTRASSLSLAHSIHPQERSTKRANSGDGEDADVDIDGIEEPPAPVVSVTPASPLQHTESPEQSKTDNKTAETIGSPDASSQNEQLSNVKSPSPPKSPMLDETSDAKINEPVSQSSTSMDVLESSQAEAITSQENFSQFDASQKSSSAVSQSLSSVSQDPISAHNTTIEEEPEAMDTSQVVESSQDGMQSSSPPRASENEESQHSISSASAPPSSKSVPQSVPKSRTKSQSRSNTDDVDGDDADLEDGEIMDDEEEEPKVVSTTSSKDKKEKEKERSTKASSTSSSRLSDKERSNRDKEKERDKDKDKHRKDKKRSKRDEEKEKHHKDASGSSKSNKKRKASDAAESEQEDNPFVRGVASPGFPVQPPTADPWSVAVEEFGDDSKVSRAKRRRESDGESSPHHHHHSSRPTREATPPGQGSRRQPDTNSNRNNKRPGGREERKEPKSDVICAYFMQGKCQKSAIDCTFSHDAVPPRKMELCKFWMMECCAKKEKCLYLHNDFPCKYFHTGLICKAGDRCKFSHSPLNDGTKQVLLKHIETAPKEILGDFPRLNRQGAINLINKMEAKLRGENVDDDTNIFEMNQNDHNNRGQMPPSHHDRHHGHGHGHGRNDDRHGRGSRDHHGNHGHGHHGHNLNQRGNNDMRGGPGRGEDRHHNNNNNNNNRNSRWEQQQPTRNDQEKLQELMEEAGISGFYKDTLETGVLPPMSQNQGPPGPFPPMQPPLLPINPHLMSQMLPGLLPPPNTVNNPALANVLASLNIPSTSIAPPTTLPTSLPQLNSGNVNIPTSISASQASEDSNPSSDGKSVPEHLPKMQQELFMRIQKQQQKNEKKMQHFDKTEPEEQEENWYSSEDEDDSKKKQNANTEISDKISSVLNQIRQQNQPQSSPTPVLPSSLPLPPLSESSSGPSFYRDTDFRNQASSSSSFKDVDLRNPSSIFKKIDIEPAKEINASLAHNGPIPYRVRKVAGIPKIDYTSVRIGLPPSTILLDPRLGPKRNNSIPAPASPTEASSPDVGVQPLTIPDGTPVFDPRTMRGGGGSSSASGRNSGPPGITPQQNNPFLDSDNRFVSLPNSGVGMNDFPSFFNRDPRGGNSGGGNNPPGSGSQAQNIAAMAAAMAAMQQQLPNMQAPGLDPNLLGMFGLPFLPQQPGGVPNPIDFQQMLAAGGPGALRGMRPPFSNQQQPPSSSWERLNQGHQGQGGGDLTPPL